MLGTSPSSIQLGAPFHLHLCLIPHSIYFLSLIFIHSLTDSPHLFARRIIYICLVTLFVFDAFQLLALSLCDSVFFSLSFFPIAFNLTPILSFSLYGGLFLQALQMFPANVILLQRHTEKRNSQQNKTEKKGMRD